MSAGVVAELEGRISALLVLIVMLGVMAVGELLLLACYEGDHKALKARVEQLEQAQPGRGR